MTTCCDLLDSRYVHAVKSNAQERQQRIAAAVARGEDPMALGLGAANGGGAEIVLVESGIGDEEVCWWCHVFLFLFFNAPFLSLSIYLFISLSTHTERERERERFFHI